ncbi:MAG: acyltransferase family protein [Bacteroidales bacterium]|nr:acyltransferase family protein [Bacteroidales bacterium]
MLKQTWCDSIFSTNKLNIFFSYATFFVLSGMTIKDYSSFIEVVKKKVKKLIVPTYIFAFSTIISMKLLSEIEPIYNIFVPQPKLIYFAMTIFCFRNSEMSGWWFLPTLIGAEFIIYFILKLKSNNMQNALILLIVIIDIIYTKLWNYPLPFCLEEALFAVFFVYIGTKHKNIIERNTQKNIFLVVILLVFTCLTIIYMKVGYGSLSMWDMTISHIIMFLFTSILGSLLIIGISIKIKNKIFSYIGKRSLLIFGVHYIFLNILDITTQKYLLKINDNKTIMFIWILFCTLLILILALVFEKITEWIKLMLFDKLI